MRKQQEETMKTVVKAAVFLCVMAGLALWVAAAEPQQGVLVASNQPPVGQGEKNAQGDGHLSRHADRSLDSAGLRLDSAPVLDVTVSYTMFLPTVLSAYCIPSPPGESDTVFDALIMCNGQTVSGQVNDNDWDDVYKILTVANQTLTISMNGTGVGGPGDADLYLFPPGTTDLFNDPSSARSTSSGNSEYIQYTVPVGGYWYIDIFDYYDGDGGTNYNVTATLSGPGAAATRAFDLPNGDRLRDRGGPKASD